MPEFIGGQSQFGIGIGSFSSGFGRIVLPWLKTGGKALMREGLGTGLQIAQDALAGRNFGQSMRGRAKQAGQRLLHGAINHVTNEPHHLVSQFRRRRK